MDISRIQSLGIVLLALIVADTVSYPSQNQSGERSVFGEAEREREGTKVEIFYFRHREMGFITKRKKE